MEQHNSAMQLATFSVERAPLLRDILSQCAAMRKLKLKLISMDEHRFYREDIYKNDKDRINTSEMKELWWRSRCFPPRNVHLNLLFRRATTTSLVSSSMVRHPKLRSSTASHSESRIFRSLGLRVRYGVIWRVPQPSHQV